MPHAMHTAPIVPRISAAEAVNVTGPVLPARSAAVAVQLVVERLQADAEEACGAILVPAALLERREDETALRLGDRRSDSNAEHRPLVTALRRRRAERRREAGGVDLVVGEDERPLDRVGELADVAGPGMAAQPADRSSAEAPG